MALDEHGESRAIAVLGALHQLAIAGLSVSPRLLRSGLGAYLRQVGQGRGTLKHADGVVKSRTRSLR